MPTLPDHEVVTSAVAACEALPPKTRRSLIDVLSSSAGTRLSATWYEFQRNSNFDKYPREHIQQVAEQAQFVQYSGGHPWITPAGHAWAMSKLSEGERARLTGA